MSNETATGPTVAPQDHIDRLRNLAEIVLGEHYRLRGRWHWSGWNGQGRKDVDLRTTTCGGRFIMCFERAGMQGGQPTFPQAFPGDRWPLMTKAMDMTRFEVCPDATDPKDPRVYRGTVRGLRNPVAEYVAAADAETVLGLIAEVDRLRALVGEPAVSVPAEVAQSGRVETVTVGSGVL